jgi:hypothetical protein
MIDSLPRTDRVLELLAIGLVAAGLIGLVTALCGVFYPAQIVLAAIACTASYGWWTRNAGGHAGPQPAAAHLLLILLVGLFFRAPPYFYVIGGQDEGVYVNMAEELARTGSLTPHDPVPDTLPEAAADAHYLRDNYQPRQYLPGVYAGDGNPPRLEFQFYHLFPVWMALFAGLFGPQAAVWALTFLALVSILFFHRVALALTGDRRAALAAGLLLAVNPLHAFFSKFPVSEVPLLAFSSMAFAFLARYWRGGARPPGRWLAIATAAMACVFTTRISGFFYLPFLLLLSAAVLLHESDRRRRRAVQLWVVSTVCLYAISVCYGLTWSGFYSRDIYQLSFAGLFGDHWSRIVVAAGAAVLAGWVALWAAARSHRVRKSLGDAWAAGRLGLGPVLVLIMLAGIRKPYLLGFTDRYLADPYMVRFGLAGAHWFSVAASSLVAAAAYLCPLVFLSFIALLLWRRRDAATDLVLMLLSYFVVHVSLLEWFMPYQPYFARYLVSEFVPWTLLFVVCGWAGMQPGRGRKVLGLALAASGLYGVALSAAQLGKKEDDQAYQTLARLAAPIDGDDLLLIDDDHIRGFAVSELKTPLVYSFGLQVADVNAAALADSAYLEALRAGHGDVYLVSCSGVLPAAFRLIDTLPFRVLAYQWNQSPPTRTFWRIDARLNLFRLTRMETAAGAKIGFGVGGRGSDWLQEGWSIEEPWGTWAVGHRATLQIDRETLGGVAALRFDLRAFVTPAHSSQRVVLRVGAETRELNFRYPDTAELQTEIPLDPALQKAPRPLTIELKMPDAVSPQSLGLGRDKRVIGAGLSSIELVRKRD